MPEDRSLDDFAGTDAADPDGTETDSPDAETGPDDAATASADADDAETPPADADDVEPAVATSTFHADGAACDRCGDRSERRWRDGDAFVCADCVSW